jgi:arylsulfatase A-like enzyme/tetratricopeptide (TPR) repeat protein
MSRRKRKTRARTTKDGARDTRATEAAKKSWRRPSAIAAALGVLALVAALFWPRPDAGVRREAGLDVLLITVDTLRADALGSYGHPRGATPWMDRLAAAGVRFEGAHAHNVLTLPSHANILSGLYPQDHGVRDNAGFRFPEDVATLAVLLKEHGYRTGAFVSAFPLDSRFGLGRGFDVYDDSFVDAVPRPTFLEQERPGPATVALARQWLDAERARPAFCWVHLYEPHFPYAPPEPFAGRFRDDPYLGDVAAADAALEPLLAPLLAAGEDGRTLVVLTSDHGEALGDHGEATHGVFAYEATLAVPFVLYQPRLLAPHVVVAPARHVDLLPTVLDALALPVPPGLRGRSLLPPAAGEDAGEAPPTYFEALSGQLNRGWAPLYGVLDGGAKAVDLPIPELYDLAADPGEAENLADSQPRRLAELRTLLADLRAGDRGAAASPEDAETRERLRSLGYLSGGGTVASSYGPEDDPKRLIALDAELQEIAGLAAAGEARSALARCRELVRRRPGMPIALLQLAHLERESGDLDAAASALREALAVNPENPAVVSQLGTTLAQTGRTEEAVAVLEPYAKRDPPDVDVLVAYGLALAKQRRTDDALAVFARARAADPTNAALLVDAGTVHLMAGDVEGARAAFASALAENPGVARAHRSLGVLAAEAGRLDEAADHWRQAVRLDPREYEKLLAMGMHFARQGRMEAARTLLDVFVDSAPPAVYGEQIKRVRELLEG